MRLTRSRTVITAIATAMTLAAAAAIPAAASAATRPAVIQPVSTSGISGWTADGSYQVSSLSDAQGVATDNPPGGSPSEVYRGDIIPSKQLSEGWTHVGDPDSTAGYIFDAYQSGASSPTSKMYLVTTPSGSEYEYKHTLASGEQANNSFAAVSPDSQWLVSGEYGTMNRLLVFPAPYLNSSTGTSGGSLSLSGQISLNTPVNNIQGCDFVTSTKLICSSNDTSQSIFANQFPLLQVTLSAPLSGGSVTGTVTDLGSIPQNSICSGTFEAEGLDYDPVSGILRVEMVQPSYCIVATTVYEYKQA